MGLTGVRVFNQCVDPVGELVARLLCDLGGRVAACRDEADVVIDDSQRAAPRAPDQIWLHMPSFPPGHPRQVLKSSVAAEVAAALHEPPVGGPRVPPVAVAAPVAALIAANGVLAALWARQRGAPGQAVRVSVLEAGFVAQELAALFTLAPPHSWTTLQWAGTPFIAPYQCADGAWIYLHAGLAPHLSRLIRALRQVGCDRAALSLRRALSERTLEDPSSVASVWEAARAQRALARVFRERPAAAWEQGLGALGVCLVVVRGAGEWARSAPAVASGQAVQHGGRWGLGPWVEVEGHKEPLALPYNSGQAPAAGLRVLDLSQVIAGPVAARTLAWLGAEVIRIENPHLRAPWVEAFHVVFSAGKRSATVDLKETEARQAFVDFVQDWAPHVVVHNLTDGAEARLGEVLAAWAPGTVVTRISAYGRRGPWAGRPGWEQTVQAACGVQLDFAHTEVPELMPVPVHDLCTGLVASLGTLAGLMGEGREVSAALSATALWLQGERVFQGSGRLPRSQRGHALARSRTDRWLRARDAQVFLASRVALSRLGAIEGLERLAQVSFEAQPGILEQLVSGESVHTWQERTVAAGLQEAVGWLSRVSLGEALPLSSRRRTHHRCGDVTEIRCPLSLSGTPLREADPAPARGAESGLFGQASPPQAADVEGLRRDIRWLTGQAKWAAWVGARDYWR